MDEASECPDGTQCQGAGYCTKVGELKLWDDAVIVRPSVAALGNGGYAVAWAGPGGGGQLVWMRRFGPDNFPIEGAQPVSNILEISQANASVTAMPSVGSEAVAIVWQNGPQGSIQMRVFPAVGQAAWDPVPIENQSPLTDQAHPIGIQLAADQVGVFRFEGLSEKKEFLRFSASDGTAPPPQSWSLAVESKSDVFFASLSAAPDGQGGAWAVTVIQEAEEEPNWPNVMALHTDASGKLQSAAHWFASELPSADNASIAVADTGDVVVAYDCGYQSSSTAIRANIILADNGKPAGSFVKVNQISPGNQRRPSVSWVAGQGYFFVWDGPPLKFSARRILGRLFDLEMKPVYKDKRVGENKALLGALESDARSATLNDGRVVVVWRKDTGAKSRLRSRILEPALMKSWPNADEPGLPN
jgi:hypothetical protein